MKNTQDPFGDFQTLEVLAEFLRAKVALVDRLEHKL